MIKTSVIIPVYNTAPYLEECINSVFSQTQKEIEVIVINDGSTDDSSEVLLQLQKRYSELIIIEQENCGLGYTRNVGIERARGEYIYFLDSDDYILEDTLANCYECASKNKLDLVLFDALTVDDSGERDLLEPNDCDRCGIIEERDEIFTGVYFLEKYYQKSYIPMVWLVYCSGDFIKRNRVRFLPRVYFEDNEFYCRIMMLAERMMYIPQMFYRYRCRKSSITGTDFNLRKAKDYVEVVGAIADLKTLNEGKGWHVVRKISLGLLQYVANACHSDHLYSVDGKLSERILHAWVKICGTNIEDANSIEDIDYIYKICLSFPDSDLTREKWLIDDKRKRLLIQLFEQLPLNQKGSKVAIYGCGKYTDRIFDFYEEWVGNVEADVIFLDSYVKDDNTKYRGFTVYPISRINEKELDYILISSPQYEEEMNGMIKQFYKSKCSTVSLYGDLHICL